MSTSSSEDNEIRFKPRTKPKLVNKKLEGNEYDKHLDAAKKKCIKILHQKSLDINFASKNLRYKFCIFEILILIK